MKSERIQIRATSEIKQKLAFLKQATPQKSEGQVISMLIAKEFAEITGADWHDDDCDEVDCGVVNRG